MKDLRYILRILNGVCLLLISLGSCGSDQVHNGDQSDQVKDNNPKVAPLKTPLRTSVTMHQMANNCWLSASIQPIAKFFPDIFDNSNDEFAKAVKAILPRLRTDEGGITREETERINKAFWKVFPNYGGEEGKFNALAFETIIRKYITEIPTAVLTPVYWDTIESQEKFYTELNSALQGQSTNITNIVTRVVTEYKTKAVEVGDDKIIYNEMLNVISEGLSEKEPPYSSLLLQVPGVQFNVYLQDRAIELATKYDLPNSSVENIVTKVKGTIFSTMEWVIEEKIACSNVQPSFKESFVASLNNNLGTGLEYNDILLLHPDTFLRFQEPLLQIDLREETRFTNEHHKAYYELVGFITYPNQAHFVAYTKLDGIWSRYNDLEGTTGPISEAEALKAAAESVSYFYKVLP